MRLIQHIWWTHSVENKDNKYLEPPQTSVGRNTSYQIKMVYGNKHVQKSNTSNIYKIRHRRNTMILFGSVLLFLTLIQSTSCAPMMGGDNSVTLQELMTSEYVIDLPFTLRIFGDAKFSKIYINRVGAVSFGGPITVSKLESVKNKVIVFAPLLLQPESPESDGLIEVKLTFSDAELADIESKFRQYRNDDTILVQNAITINWREDSENDTGNEYQIHFAVDEDKTYVIYEYHQVGRFEDENGFAKAGMFALEDLSVSCLHELPESGKPTIAQVGNFSSRIDLPLECSTLHCDRPVENASSEIKAQTEGYFFETHTTTSWSFYLLYMCLPQHVKNDGSVSIKQGCIDDPDYYTYSWRELTSIDYCFQEMHTTHNTTLTDDTLLDESDEIDD